MKPYLLVCIFVCFAFPSFSQYFLRGEIKDEKGRQLERAKILLVSKGNMPFYSGNFGAFGILCPYPQDTITVFYDGYEVYKKAVNTKVFNEIILKMLPETASLYANKLSSRTTNLEDNSESYFATLGESYSSLIENQFVNAKQYPETGFSLNIDKASYSNIRRFINNGMYVPSNAVRIEEMLNYFDLRGLDFQKPRDSSSFSAAFTITNCPWNNNNFLLFVQLQAPKINLDNIPPNNLVLLIDISGSMDHPAKLPLLQSAFKLLIENLRAEDKVSIVTYGGGVHVALSTTSGNNKQKINNIIDSLYADGDTPGENAIRTAYSIAKANFIPNGNNRIILATDGDFNVGQTTEQELENLVTFQKQSGIFLTCLGVGMGNYKDSKLEILAKKGNGNFAYIDNIHEAEKILIQEFTKTMYAVAIDAYANVQFNPAVIRRYRLIGFDNKKSAIRDTTSLLEGGEVGSGHNMMAVFEITPAENINATENLAGTLNLIFQLPKNPQKITQKFILPYRPISFSEAPPQIKLATAIVMFGSLLRQSKFIKNFGFQDAINLAQTSINTTNASEQELLQLMQKANNIYNYRKKR
ncbi:VWA domain-containing protein [Hydrotalea sp.]|uniref:vWA domain-containing protein n=3 Tax=Hydrotalea sp. TaxID=2881279 RepID=UPI002639C8A6|nr:VWA domain-containing protein [Hydrotalea sp.]